MQTIDTPYLNPGLYSVCKADILDSSALKGNVPVKSPSWFYIEYYFLHTSVLYKPFFIIIAV